MTTKDQRTRRAGSPRQATLPKPQAVDTDGFHDFLIMSHGAGTRPTDRGNHACLNSFTSSSWIMSEGGCPNTVVGWK
jgi:hypothetical protein